MNRKNLFDKKNFFYLCLLIFVIIIRLPTFSLPIDNDTGARAYHASLILQGEPLYSTHHPNHHLPAIYYTYAIIFKLLGEQTNSLQLFLIFWVWLNGIFLYKLGSKLTNSFGGILAAFFYVFIGSMTNIAGDTAQTELFVNTFMTISIWLCADLVQHKRKPILYYLLGGLCAICFLYKAVYIAPLVVALSMNILRFVFKTKHTSWKLLVLQIVLIFLGFVTIISMVIGYFYSQDLLSRFLMVFTNGSGYVNLVEMPWIFIIIIPFYIISSTNLSLLLIGVLNITRTFFISIKNFSIVDSKIIIKLLIIIWFAVSIIEAGFSKFIFFHYGLLLLPSLVLLASSDIVELIKIIKKNKSKNIRFVYLLPGLFIFAIIGNTLFNSHEYLSGYIDFRTGELSLENYVINHTVLGYQNVIASNIAKYVESNSSPDDLILNWSELAQIPYLANRQLSTDTVWPLHLENLGDPERALTSEPLFIVVGPSFFEDDPIPHWLEVELSDNYIIDKIFDRFSLYRRVRY